MECWVQYLLSKYHASVGMYFYVSNADTTSHFEVSKLHKFVHTYYGCLEANMMKKHVEGRL